MSYTSQGADFSATEIRISSLGTFIHKMQAQGVSDGQIRTLIATAADSPCRGPSGEMLCSSAELNAAFLRAEEIAKQAKPASRSNPWLWGGIALGGILLFSMRKK